MQADLRDAIAALDAATFEELTARFPELWQQLGPQVVDATAGGSKALTTLIKREQGAARTARATLSTSRNAVAAAGALESLARSRLLLLATAQVLQHAASQLATGNTATAVAADAAPQDAAPLGRWSGTLINGLFFEKGQGLRRKPVSMTVFGWLWPWVTQRRHLMPLVQPRGIYCFYSRELIWGLARLIDGRRCVEIAAGDGTMSRFLNTAGVAVTAVDDHSWAHSIAFPAEVEKLDAVEALNRHRPQVVICSFPPADNAFEKRVFRTASVELYIVITTRHRGTAGDAAAWEEQTAFEGGPDASLSRLVLPPELDPEVRVYRRRQP